MTNCFACDKKKGFPLCTQCKTDPFKVEFTRQKLAEEKDYSSLFKLYDSSYKEIKDLNTPSMWDEKFTDAWELKKQDGMTKDRMRGAVAFLPAKARKVLDIGAGAGWLEELLSQKKGLKLYGNDFSSECVNNLNRKYNGKFTKQSIYQMKYPEKYFDCVFILEVLEHIPPKKILPVLKRINQVLKKGGQLIVSVPTNEGLDTMQDNPNAHVRMYTLPLIQAELAYAGFEVLRVNHYHAFNRLYTVKKLLSKIFTKKWQPNNYLLLARKST